MDPLRTAYGVLLTIGLGALAGCTSSQVLVPHRIPLVAAPQTAGQATQEEQLIDVAIVVFDPGVPEGDIGKEQLEKLLEDGVFVHVRRAEAVQMAVLLRDTLQRSGQWGAVWIAPEESLAADVNVTARILQSDGYIVRVEATAVDSSGTTWIDKRYELETAAAAYRRERHGGLDPYQDLFNAIANDLAAARARLSAERIDEIKTIAALRYAAALSPEAFGGYVAARRDGAYVPVRLPALDDPLFERTLSVRQRERLFLDTLDRHYENLVVAAQPSYDSWREGAREESITIRELTRGARLRTGLGIVAMLGSMMYGGGDLAFLRNGMLSVGAELLSMGAATVREKDLHAAALEELSASFDDEIAPLTVDIAGVQHRLTGTAELQYAELRELLRLLFAEETGLELAAPAVAPPEGPGGSD
ncbi:MAG TPA: hypothetical protein VF322_09365 [Gammaproteobacteria bacterium]